VEGIGDLATRHGTYPAQVLGEDEVGLDALDELGVEGVERLAVLDGLAHRAVDVGGRRPVVERQAAPRHDGFGASSRREVAPVGHPFDVVSKPQRIRDLSRRREKGDDPQSVSRSVTLTERITSPTCTDWATSRPSMTYPK